MLDTTDYDFDWSNYYTGYFQSSNLYTHDVLYADSCGTLDFAGSYVNPRFLMSYLAGDYAAVKRLSGKPSIKELAVSARKPPHL